MAKSILKDNKVILRGYVSQPTVAMLHSKNDKFIKGKKVLLENTRYTIHIDTAIRGDERFDTDSEFHNVWVDFYYDMGIIGKNKQNLVTIYGQLDNTELAQADSITAELQHLDIKVSSMYRELGIKYPGNVATAYILTAAPDLGESYQDIYESFTMEVKNSEWGRAIKDRIYSSQSYEEDKKAERAAYIERVKDFDIHGLDPEGRVFQITPQSISQQPAKVTIIDFWASWCGPCREANKDLKGLYNRFADQLDIIAYSLDKDKEAWKKAIKEDNLEWLQVASKEGEDSSAVTKHFSIGTIPFNLVLNRDGEIIAVNVHNFIDLNQIVTDEIGR